MGDRAPDRHQLSKGLEAGGRGLASIKLQQEGWCDWRGSELGDGIGGEVREVEQPSRSDRLSYQMKDFSFCSELGGTGGF